MFPNDDGYQAKGIKALVNMISDLADVVVCAPDSGRSGYSCAFSAALPITIKEQKSIENFPVWSCSGTPVDCIKIAIDKWFKDEKPTLILSGINHGDNASINNHYSGTVGVAKEGCMKGIPSIAFSLCNERADADFEPLRPYIRTIVKQVLEESLPKNTLLNVNFPNLPTFKGVKVCRMGYGFWDKEVENRNHPLAMNTIGWLDISSIQSPIQKIQTAGHSRMAMWQSPQQPSMSPHTI